jgi:acetolactate synthase-1/2/3 large subunit
MSKSKNPSILNSEAVKSKGRRGFLRGAAAGAAASAAALVTPGVTEKAQAQPPQNAPSAAPPSVVQVAAERGGLEVQTTDRPGADYMVDVIKSLGFEYCICNPGSSFRGLHESLVSYGGNKPEFITCNHEEIAAAAANGYAKIEGKPALTMVHGTVGLQHAAMAIYNAYCDQAPMVIIGGNVANAAERRGYVEWVHSVQDVAAMVRDYTKWDDNPMSLEHWGESAVRAYNIAMTPPTMPVVLVADGELQESPIENPNLKVPKHTVPVAPSADPSTVNEIARMLIAAQNPVLVAARAARTAKGLESMIELAELLQCSVIDQKRRMNFPNRHPLNQTLRQRAAIQDADLIVGIEVWDFYGVVHALGGQLKVTSRSIIKPGTKLVSISASELATKNNYQSMFRYNEVDMSVSADGETMLPALIDAVKKQLTGDQRARFAERGKKLGELQAKALEDTRTAAAYAWDASPISTARMSMELYNQIRNDDWSLVSDSFWVSNWPQRLWDMKKHHHYIGGAGGEGVGYLAGATVGAALANKKYGRLSVSIQPDGDLMYGPGALWTAAHHRIPLLILMHNNRAYHQEIMQLQRMAGQHNRGIDKCDIGTAITDPNIDYAKLAQSMGVEASGPVADPALLGPAIKRGIEVVKSGRPYLIDVVTQGR